MFDVPRASCILLLMIDGSSLARCLYRWCKLILQLNVDIDVRCFKLFRASWLLTDRSNTDRDVSFTMTLEGCRGLEVVGGACST